MRHPQVVKGKAHSGHSMLLTMKRRIHNAKDRIGGLRKAPRSPPGRVSAPAAAASRETFGNCANDKRRQGTASPMTVPEVDLESWLRIGRLVVSMPVPVKWPVPQHETIQASCCQGVIPTCLHQTMRNADFSEKPGLSRPPALAQAPRHHLPPRCPAKPAPARETMIHYTLLYCSVQYNTMLYYIIEHATILSCTICFNRLL